MMQRPLMRRMGAMNDLPHGCDAAFQSWVDPLLDQAGAYAYSILRKREDAEDAIQDALLKAYQNLNRYSRDLSFKGWWFAIIRNCCLDLLRRRQVRAAVVAVDPSERPSTGRSAHEDFVRKDALTWALHQLSAAHREVLELRYFGDCSYAEIATVLGIAEGTVMSRLHAARKALAVVYRKETL